MRNFFKLFLLLLPLFAFSQTNTALERDAKELGNGFLTQNFTTFLKYTHPKIITMMGGNEKTVQTLKQLFSQLKSQGITFTNIKFGTPGHQTKLKNEMVSWINQTVSVNTPNGEQEKTTKLIAFSFDGGQHWKFADTNNKSLAEIQKVFPEITGAMLE